MLIQSSRGMYAFLCAPPPEKKGINKLYIYMSCSFIVSIRRPLLSILYRVSTRTITQIAESQSQKYILNPGSLQFDFSQPAQPKTKLTWVALYQLRLNSGPTPTFSDRNGLDKLMGLIMLTFHQIGLD